MNIAKPAIAVMLLLCLSQAQAGLVYRCKAPNGQVYYSDKGCDTGDPAAEAPENVNMSVLGTGKFKPKAAPPSKLKLGGKASGPQPAYRTHNPYTRRAEAGAARADQALKQ